MRTIAMILAGGAGTRLTVLSAARAKPALPLRPHGSPRRRARPGSGAFRPRDAVTPRADRPAPRAETRSNRSWDQMEALSRPMARAKSERAEEAPPG